MTGFEYSRKLDELDRLLNDPDAPMQPDRVWCLLAEVSRPEFAAAEQASSGSGQRRGQDGRSQARAGGPHER
jgi:hypothetical protein